jgi:magnesium-transporting ATPase (P-type)
VKELAGRVESKECVYALLVTLRQIVDDSLVEYLIQLKIIPLLLKLIDLGVENISYEASWIMINISYANSQVIKPQVILELAKHSKEILKEQVTLYYLK